MKTKLIAAGRAVWNFLTVIPGWPGAGKVARTLYGLPLVVPLLGLLLLVGWGRFSREPEIQKVRAASHSASLLEEGIAGLRFEYSEAQSAEVVAVTARLAEGLIQGPEDMAHQLAAMRAIATTQGWEATLHASDPEPGAPAAGVALAFLTVRGRLIPLEGNRASFASLLTLLDRLVPAGKRGSLTRLTVRADDQGRLAVEFGVRFAARPPDEKTP